MFSPWVSPSAGSGQILALPDKPSIAVLPFENMSGDPEQDYFADGMVDDIITALSHFKALFVIAPAIRASPTRGAPSM
jgi:adenylate cyclase